MQKNIPNKSISIEIIKEMFENIEKQAIWDLTKPMLWGYYFTHHEPKLLEKVKKELEENGYHYIDIYLSDKDSLEESDLWWLHIEKEEKHTPYSLDIRNDEFYIFAEKHKIDSYDGMDVGPPKAL